MEMSYSLKNWVPFTQLVVMMVVRKLLDYIFTQTELLALDDALPGSKGDEKAAKKVEELLPKKNDGNVEVNGT